MSCHLYFHKKIAEPKRFDKIVYDPAKVKKRDRETIRLRLRFNYKDN